MATGKARRCLPGLGLPHLADQLVVDAPVVLLAEELRYDDDLTGTGEHDIEQIWRMDGSSDTAQIPCDNCIDARSTAASGGGIRVGRMDTRTFIRKALHAARS